MNQLKPNAIINDCYILRERLGFDSFCEIWKASALYSAAFFIMRFFLPHIPKADLDAQRELVLKAYDVRDDAIFDVVEAERFGDILFLSSGYDGQLSLGEVSDGRSRFSLEHACGFGLEIARGLDAFHRQGLVYGMVDPDSVYMALEGDRVNEIRLLKPGYSPLLGLLGDTDRDFMLAHHAFLAPEGKPGASASMDARSDVYSLGALLFFMLTNRPPYGRGASPDALAASSADVRFVAESLMEIGTPDGMSRIVINCLRANPDMRYRGMVQLITALKGFLDERRLASISSGARDPLAELERLNKQSSGHEAATVIRSLDMAEYFNALSRARDVREAPAEERLYPRNGERADELSAKRAREGNERNDDDSLTADDYLKGARESIGVSDGGGKAPVKNAAPDERAAAVPPESAVEPPAAQRFAAERFAEERPAGAEGTAPGREPRKARPAREGGKGKKQKRGAEASAKGVSWHYEGIPSEELEKSLYSSFLAAKRGRGIFRYLNLPNAASSIEAARKAFLSMAKQSLFLRAPFAQARFQDLSAVLAKELRAARGRMPESERKACAKPFAAVNKAFKAALQPEGVDFRALASLFAGLGSAARPLVLILFCDASMDASQRAFLLSLAEIAPKSRICVFALFKGQPPWISGEHAPQAGAARTASKKGRN
jgi:serine/threonine protein kinase